MGTPSSERDSNLWNATGNIYGFPVQLFSIKIYKSVWPSMINAFYIISSEPSIKTFPKLSKILQNAYNLNLT